jgi:alpha-N-arabinofuranosidase
MANLAQLVNVIAPIFTNKEGLYLQTIYFPLAEYGKQKSLQSLDVLVKSPNYTPPNRRPLGYLDVSSTYDAKTGTVYVNVLNRSEKNDIATRLENVTGTMGSEVGVWELKHADLKATHTFGDDRKVRPATRTVTPAQSRGGFTYTFPKASLTILKLKVS